jgi:Na+-transporting NADH:ubiquinone oxidoreductase subunit NqrA
VSGNQQVAQDVVIKISVDEQKAFKSFEVYDSFTAL